MKYIQGESHICLKEADSGSFVREIKPWMISSGQAVVLALGLSRTYDQSKGNLSCIESLFQDSQAACFAQAVRGWRTAADKHRGGQGKCIKAG